MACKLRAQFYARKVEQLHETNQHSWWKHVRMDDTTLTELIVNNSHVSEMQTFLQLLQT